MAKTEPGKNVMTRDAEPDLAALDSGWEDEEESEPGMDELDAGWVAAEVEVERAEVAAGMDANARREAKEERAAQRKEKLRARKASAKEKRKAHAESIRQKQKPKRRASIPSYRANPTPRVMDAEKPDGAPTSRATSVPRSQPLAARTQSRNRPARPTWVRRWDSIRIVLLVAAVLAAVGAVVFAWTRRGGGAP